MGNLLRKWIVPFLVARESLAKEIVLLVLEHFTKEVTNGLKPEAVTRVKNQWDKET